MHQKDISLTLISDKPKLNQFVEVTQNIFKVVSEVYCDKIINFADEIYLALKYPLKVSGWDCAWYDNEKVMLNSAVIKCLEIIGIVSEAKNSLSELREILNKFSLDFQQFPNLSEKSEVFVMQFKQFILELKIKIVFFETKISLTQQENLKLNELKDNLSLLEESIQALEFIKPTIEKQAEELPFNLEALAAQFFKDAMQFDQFCLQQEAPLLINLTNNLDEQVKNTYVLQSEEINYLKDLFINLSENFHEIITVANEIIQNANDLCAKAEHLLRPQIS